MTTPEGNPVDLAEQADEPTRDAPADPAAVELPLEVSEADAAEQARVVELDEDEYR